MTNLLVWSGEAAAILVNGQGGGSANRTYCNASLLVIDVEPRRGIGWGLLRRRRLRSHHWLLRGMMS